MDWDTVLLWAHDCLKRHYPMLSPKCWFTPNTTSDWGKVTIHLYWHYEKDAVKTAELEWSNDLITLMTTDMVWDINPQELNKV